jgi:DNA-binding XRE family transcriptional regulator
MNRSEGWEPYPRGGFLIEGFAEGAMDDQTESWHRVRKNFRDHITDESEKLVARYESTGDTWHFEGSHDSERTFKALAREGGFLLAGEISLDAHKHWLNALRTNQVAPVGPDSTTDLSTDGTQSRLGGPLPTVMDKLFSRSALFCLEWATEVAIRLKFFEQSPDASADEPSEASKTSTKETEVLYGTSEPGELVANAGFDWARYLTNPVAIAKKGGRPEGQVVDGRKLREYRGKWSQEEFAEKCGVSLATIQRGEAGEPWTDRTFDDVAKTITLLIGKPVTSEDLKNLKK